MQVKFLPVNEILNTMNDYPECKKDNKYAFKLQKVAIRMVNMHLIAKGGNEWTIILFLVRFILKYCNITHSQLKAQIF
jgi:hypothetical protein